MITWWFAWGRDFCHQQICREAQSDHQQFYNNCWWFTTAFGPLRSHVCNWRAPSGGWCLPQEGRKYLNSVLFILLIISDCLFISVFWPDFSCLWFMLLIFHSSKNNIYSNNKTNDFDGFVMLAQVASKNLNIFLFQ